jgi:hypothetical protein
MKHKAKGIEVKGNVGEHPTTCDHCGGEVEEIGLVAPKCLDCGRFSLSHISFGPPEEVEITIVVEEENS